MFEEGPPPPCGGGPGWGKEAWGLQVPLPNTPHTGEGKILFWVASRGHHADVGGTAPGSMTPRATIVDEEGVLIDNFRLVERGRFREAELTKLLTDHPFPCRNPVQNVADLKAQIAANEKGVLEIRKMVREFGLEVVQAYMVHVRDNAAESVRRVIEGLHDSEVEYPTDQGSMIKVRDQRRQAEPPRQGRFHRHLRGQAEQMSTPRPVTAPPCSTPSASWWSRTSR